MIKTQGSNLVSELRENSGLDQTFFDSKMNELCSRYSLNPDSLELEQFRLVLADYLQSLILQEDIKGSNPASA